jgi:short-subunit dehydrogenase
MLQKKVIVITGASSGIGASLARRLAQEKAILVLAARRKALLEDIANEIAHGGGQVEAVPTDITDRAQAEHLIAVAVTHFGRIDVLINNAGRGHLSSVEETTDDMIASIFAVNVFALWHTVRPALIAMKQRGTGHIVNIASMAGKIGYPFNSAYVAAKHACVGFTHALRMELTGTDIHATVVCPGSVNTPWASVTEGRPMLQLFSASGAVIKRIASDQHLPLPPVEGLLSSEAVAERIVEALVHPLPEFYTHAGTADFVRLSATDREEAERHLRAVVLGEREVYQRLFGEKHQRP